MELKNVIVSYRGGGYDGCFWEPNIGYFDFQGNYHPCIATGCGGLYTKEEVEEEIAEPHPWKDRRLETIPLTQEGVDDLFGIWRRDFVAHFVNELNKDKLAVMHNYGSKFKLKCTKCGKYFYGDFEERIEEMVGLGYYTGDGGIGIICDDLYCDDCYEEAVKQEEE